MVRRVRTRPAQPVSSGGPPGAGDSTTGLGNSVNHAHRRRIGARGTISGLPKRKGPHTATRYQPPASDVKLNKYQVKLSVTLDNKVLYPGGVVSGLAVLDTPVWAEGETTTPIATVLMKIVGKEQLRNGQDSRSAIVFRQTVMIVGPPVTPVPFLGQQSEAQQQAMGTSTMGASVSLKSPADKSVLGVSNNSLTGASISLAHLLATRFVSGTTHEFPFQFELPQVLPSSWMANFPECRRSAEVVYYVKFKTTFLDTFDVSQTAYFDVVNPAPKSIEMINSLTSPPVLKTSPTAGQQQDMPYPHFTPVSAMMSPAVLAAAAATMGSSGGGGGGSGLSSSSNSTHPSPQGGGGGGAHMMAASQLSLLTAIPTVPVTWGCCLPSGSISAKLSTTKSTYVMDQDSIELQAEIDVTDCTSEVKRVDFELIHVVDMKFPLTLASLIASDPGSIGRVFKLERKLAVGSSQRCADQVVPSPVKQPPELYLSTRAPPAGIGGGGSLSNRGSRSHSPSMSSSTVTRPTTDDNNKGVGVNNATANSTAPLANSFSQRAVEPKKFVVFRGAVPLRRQLPPSSIHLFCKSRYYVQARIYFRGLLTPSVVTGEVDIELAQTYDDNLNISDNGTHYGNQVMTVLDLDEDSPYYPTRPIGGNGGGGVIFLPPSATSGSLPAPSSSCETKNLSPLPDSPRTEKPDYKTSNPPIPLPGETVGCNTTVIRPPSNVGSLLSVETPRSKQKSSAFTPPTRRLSGTIKGTQIITLMGASSSAHLTTTEQYAFDDEGEDDVVTFNRSRGNSFLSTTGGAGGSPTVKAGDQKNNNTHSSSAADVIMTPPMASSKIPVLQQTTTNETPLYRVVEERYNGFRVLPPPTLVVGSMDDDYTSAAGPRATPQYRYVAPARPAVAAAAKTTDHKLTSSNSLEVSAEQKWSGGFSSATANLPPVPWSLFPKNNRLPDDKWREALWSRDLGVPT